MHFAEVIYLVKKNIEDGKEKLYIGFLHCHNSSTVMSSKDPVGTKTFNTQLLNLCVDDMDEILKEFEKQFGHPIENSDKVYPLGQLCQDLDHYIYTSFTMHLQTVPITGQHRLTFGSSPLISALDKFGCEIIPKLFKIDNPTVC